MAAFQDISGVRSGRLVAINRAKNRGSETMWNCICDCGSSHIARASSIKSGIAISCGCSRNLGNSKHGMSSAPIYDVWVAMKSRCLNPANPRYKDYAGRGIELCDSWMSFENFYKDMGDIPKGKSLDRIDNNKGYFKENCRWATSAEQVRNTRITEKQNVGISLLPSGKYRAVISVDNKRVHIGVFATIDLAIKARKQAEKTYWR